MDIERFNSKTDTFNVLDFTAIFEFKTKTSIGFSLGKLYSNSTVAFDIFGKMQVHHPCSGDCETRIMIKLRKKLIEQYQCQYGLLTRSILIGLGIGEYTTTYFEVCDCKYGTVSVRVHPDMTFGPSNSVNSGVV